MSRPRVVAAVEAWSAALGWWDHRVAGRDHTVWTVIDGTKALSTSPAGARIAAVLVSYNDRELTLDCIDALRRSTHPLERIVVVDNAGSDGTAAAVASAHPDVHVLRLAGNDGLAHGFNEGVRQALAAGCDYILQVNPDVVIASNFLERALEAAAREPRAASIGGPVFYADDPESRYGRGSLERIPAARSATRTAGAG